jgi:lipoate---protein ligase
VKYLFSSNKDPFFNLALEEYLFQHYSEDFFLMYVNKASVICGKHQIPCKETDVILAYENNIDVCRRFSGGGTVYHDPGNLNFCYIMNQKTSGINIDFKRFIEPVVSFLKQLKIPVYINERNNILIDGKKISGNAEHISKSRILHHGTLLFDTDLSMLEKLTHRDKSNFEDRSVKSVSSEITNIKNYLDGTILFSDFSMNLFSYLTHVPEYELFTVEQGNLSEIEEIRQTKYCNPEWIFGYSPAYVLKKNVSIENDRFSFILKVENGRINDINIYTDTSGFLEFMAANLNGKLHSPSFLKDITDMFLQKNPEFIHLKTELIRIFF